MSSQSAHARMIHPRTLHSLEFDKIVTFLSGLCKSSGGRQLASALEPYRKQEDAENALQLYEECATWSAVGPANSIPSFPDIDGIMETLAKKRGSAGLPPSFAFDADAFWALREMLRVARQATESIRAPQAATGWPHLLALAENSPFPDQLLAALNRCLSDDGLLKDESSPELYQLRSELRKLHQSCLKKVRDYAQQYNMLAYLQDEFMTLSSDRYVLPLKANFKGRMQGIIHDWSQTGETCYFEPYFLVDINNRLQELKHEEREEERRVLQYLTGLLDAGADGVEEASRLLARLDFLQAVRKLAEKIDAHAPTFCNAADGIEILSARHPLLTLARLDKPSDNPVRPIDLVLRAGERALIITGGNAGGKTVCLKSLGLLAVMAMAGLPIPAAGGSRLPWFERIDAFIGDEQSLADNVSTFSAQIEHLAKALPHLDSHGLALLDEFGAGTDPAEGAALAQATHDELLEKQCFVVSATHFPALKSYALSRPGARAATMLFDAATGRPLYKLAYDQVGASQALAVAADYGLPESILSRARHYLLQDGEDSGAILKKLNDLAARREKEIEQLKQQQAKTAATLADQREKLAAQRKRMQTEVQDNIRELMRAWKAGKASAKQSLKAMSGLREELGLPEPANESVLPVPDAFTVGQKVRHTGFNKNGTITDLDERRNRARVDLNGVSIWAEMKDLRAAVQPRASAPQAGAIAPARGSAAVLDVRGQRADEALAQVEKFLDSAILAGSGEIEIVHGRGTGALRREIHNYLRSFPAVASIALAPEDQGGDGKTVVTLK